MTANRIIGRISVAGSSDAILLAASPLSCRCQEEFTIYVLYIPGNGG